MITVIAKNLSANKELCSLPILSAPSVQLMTYTLANEVEIEEIIKNLNKQYYRIEYKRDSKPGWQALIKVSDKIYSDVWRSHHELMCTYRQLINDSEVSDIHVYLTHRLDDDSLVKEELNMPDLNE